MRKPALLLIFATAAILTMGAGCANSTNTNNATSTAEAELGSDDLAFSAIISPGIEVVKLKSGTTTAATQSYVETLDIYGKSGMRFQFANCSANPGSLNMKLGTKFMIDNRDGKVHKIGIGPKIYQLGAYDFVVVSVQKIGTFNITCDGGGSASVGIQK